MRILVNHTIHSPVVEMSGESQASITVLYQQCKGNTSLNAERASEAAGRASEPAGRTSEPAGRASNPAGRASELAERA